MALIFIAKLILLIFIGKVRLKIEWTLKIISNFQYKKNEIKKKLKIFYIFIKPNAYMFGVTYNIEFKKQK